MELSVKLFLTLILGFVLWAPASTFACTVCYGAPNSLQVKGAEAGVLVLLGVIVTLLTAIAGAILFFWLRARRSARVSNTLPLPSAQ